METQKIINLLHDSSNEESKFATKKWYVIDSQTTKGKFKQGDTVKFETETIKSSLCDYSGAGIKNNRKYFLPRGEIKNYNALIDGRNFYDQPINDLMKQYDEIRKLSTGYGDDYATGCLFDYLYFKDNYRLIAVDLNKQILLEADPRAIQQIVFQGVVEGENNTKLRLYTILEKSKETILEFAKGTVKVR